MGEPSIYAQSRSYKMKLTIKGEEYTNDLVGIKITSSLATGYQIVVLTIRLTPQTIILEELFGQDPIELTISLIDQDESKILEDMFFKLMLLNSEFEIAVSEIITTGTQMDRATFNLVTVTRVPFQIMSANTECVFSTAPGNEGDWFGNKTVKEMIEVIVPLFSPNAILEYDTDNMNESEIDQMFIPPTSMYKAIKLIDSNYGLYTGALALFCDYKHTLKVMNLSARITKNYTLWIEHLTTEHEEEDVTKSADDNTYFYTYDNVYTNYVGNSRYGILGSTINHIVLPSNRLYHTITHKLNDIFTDYGVIGSGGTSDFIDIMPSDRKTYYIENNGDEFEETFAIAKMAKKLSDLSRINLSVERGLRIENLIKVGEVVYFNTKTFEHIDLIGKYILYSSNLSWNREGEWQTTANLELIRTNRTIL